MELVCVRASLVRWGVGGGDFGGRCLNDGVVTVVLVCMRNIRIPLFLSISFSPFLSRLVPFQVVYHPSVSYRVTLYSFLHSQDYPPGV